MRPSLITAAIALAGFGVSAQAANFDDWPTKYKTSNDVELAVTGNFAYDYNDFSGDSALEDDDAVRRKEFGATIKKAGVFDAMVYYDFESETWLDVYLRLESKALFGRDIGKFRFGYMKVPVGMEGVTSSRALSYLETALPTQAIYQGRRTGVEWTFERPAYLLQAGAYGGKDLHGDNPGTTQVLRGVWTPHKAPGDVIHLGLAASVENPRGWHNGLGVHFEPSYRGRAKPEAGLTDVRLIDTGALGNVEKIRRTGLEGVWIKGPFSLQGEALRLDAERAGGLPDFTADGQYISASWAITGESRGYNAGNVSNIKPSKSYGAVELLARYSHLDLNDGVIQGGRQNDWTLGANWYLTSHFKFQANYVWVDAKRLGVKRDPNVFELRAQVHF